VDEVPLFGGGQARRLRRRRRIIATSASVVAMLVLGGSIFVVTQRNVATTVSLDDAVQRFRSNATGSAPEAPEPAARGSAVAAPPRGELADPEHPEHPQAPADARTVLDPSAAAAAYTLPAEGVYGYRTKGGESVSMFNAKHTYPEHTFATVRHLGGCKWEHRNEVLEEHVDTRELCGKTGSITQLLQSRQVTFFGKTDGATLRCEPATLIHRVGETPGAVTTSRCTDGKGGNAALTRTFVGTEKLTIGGRAVQAIKVNIEGRMTGRVEGESFDTLWLHPLTGMTLRWDRMVDTLATAFGAKVRYQEKASFVLESLEPQR
jgi:hypothetical protein